MSALSSQSDNHHFSVPTVTSLCLICHVGKDHSNALSGEGSVKITEVKTRHLDVTDTEICFTAELQ